MPPAPPPAPLLERTPNTGAPLRTALAAVSHTGLNLLEIRLWSLQPAGPL
jgi:hypothetical protein